MSFVVRSVFRSPFGVPLEIPKITGTIFNAVLWGRPRVSFKNKKNESPLFGREPTCYYLLILLLLVLPLLTKFLPASYNLIPLTTS